MTTRAVIFAITTVLGMTTGQVLLKLAARQGGLADILMSWSLWTALGLYGLVTASWIMLLREVDLARAYPFMAATYILVPAASVMLLGERVGWSYAVGVALIAAGILLIARA
jgi:drug/metabolite transporter (DMT)-like permease